MAITPCEKVAEEGSITWESNVTGWDTDNSWIAKQGNLVFGCIRLLSSTSVGTLPYGGIKIGSVPWKPKKPTDSAYSYISNAQETVTLHSSDITTGGDINSPWNLSSRTGMKYLFGIPFSYLTDD